MMKFLVLIFLSITQFVAHSQVNKDFKKLARKKITALELENGHCTYKFDHSGRLQEMIFQEVTSWKEVYVFDSLGNWLAYNKILVYSRGEDTLEIMTTIYDCNNVIIFHNWSSYDGEVKCPKEVDSTTFEVKWVDSVRVASLVNSSSWCPALVYDSEIKAAYSKHNQRFEKTIFLGEGSFRIDDFEVKYWKDTIWNGSMIIKSNKNGISTIDVLKIGSDEIVRSCTDCESIDPGLYSCMCTDQSGQMELKTLAFSPMEVNKDELFQRLPSSSSTQERYSYAIHPWKLYKASKKVYGKDSVTLIRY